MAFGYRHDDATDHFSLFLAPCSLSLFLLAVVRGLHGITFLPLQSLYNTVDYDPGDGRGRLPTPLATAVPRPSPVRSIGHSLSS